MEPRKEGRSLQTAHRLAGLTGLIGYLNTHCNTHSVPRLLHGGGGKRACPWDSLDPRPFWTPDLSCGCQKGLGSRLALGGGKHSHNLWNTLFLPHPPGQMQASGVEGSSKQPNIAVKVSPYIYRTIDSQLKCLSSEGAPKTWKVSIHSRREKPFDHYYYF